MKYAFKNLTFTHGGKDHLASGEASYSVFDTLDEFDVSFDDVYLIEVLSPKGWVKKDELQDYKDSVLTHLNRDENIHRALAI